MIYNKERSTINFTVFINYLSSVHLYYCNDLAPAI